MTNVGDSAPSFTLKDQNNEDVSSADLLAKGNVCLLFYPLDFTPT